MVIKTCVASWSLAKLMIIKVDKVTSWIWWMPEAIAQWLTHFNRWANKADSTCSTPPAWDMGKEFVHFHFFLKHVTSSADLLEPSPPWWSQHVTSSADLLEPSPPWWSQHVLSTLCTIQIQCTELSHTVHHTDPMYSDLSLTVHHTDPMYSDLSLTVHHTDKMYSDLSLTVHHTDQMYSAFSLTVHYTDPMYSALSLTVHHTDPMYSNCSLTVHHTDPMYSNRSLTVKWLKISMINTPTLSVLHTLSLISLKLLPYKTHPDSHGLYLSSPIHFLSVCRPLTLCWQLPLQVWACPPPPPTTG